MRAPWPVRPTSAPPQHTKHRYRGAYPAAPAIGVEDPQVTGSLRLAKWAGFAVGPDDVSNLRLILMIAIPNLAGLVLAFGLALRRRRV